MQDAGAEDVFLESPGAGAEGAGWGRGRLGRFGSGGGSCSDWVVIGDFAGAELVLFCAGGGLVFEFDGTGSCGEDASVTVGSGCSGDGKVGVLVDGAHLGGLGLPVFFGVLDDAKGIYPKIVDAELLGDDNGVLERLR